MRYRDANSRQELGEHDALKAKPRPPQVVRAGRASTWGHEERAGSPPAPALPALMAEQVRPPAQELRRLEYEPPRDLLAHQIFPGCLVTYAAARRSGATLQLGRVRWITVGGALRLQLLDRGLPIHRYVTLLKSERCLVLEGPSR